MEKTKKILYAVPIELLEEIEEYKELYHIPYTTTAISMLVSKGLEYEKIQRKKNSK